MRNIVIAICIIAHCFCAAQNPVSHKTYSGVFPCVESGGTATYSYLTAENGERVFDGHFKYTHPFQSLEGNFRNDRQVGKWVVTRPNNSPGPKALIKTIMTIHFGDNGYLDGSFKIQEFYRNGTVVDVVDATYRNGRLHGPFKGKVEKGKFSGQFKDGEPAGLWKYSWIESPVDFDKKDRYGKVSVRHINPATGDISEVMEYMPTDPQYDRSSMTYWAKEFQMRNSRMITFYPSFPLKRESLHVVGTRVIGFENYFGDDESYLLQIDIPESLFHSKELRGLWSDWDDLVLGNSELTAQDVGDIPVTVNLILDIDSSGNVELLEKDSEVSEKLNDATWSLLKKLQWTFVTDDLDSSIKKIKAGMHAYCDVTVTYDPVKMQSNQNAFNKIKESLEAEKRWEESFAPISEGAVAKPRSNATESAERGAAAHVYGDSPATKVPEDEDKIYDNPDEMPRFPDGFVGLTQFINQNLKYPALAEQEGVMGTVKVSFVIDKGGKIRDVRVVKGCHPDLDREAVRVIRRLPRFKPAKVDGRPVNSRFSVPISFKLGN